MDVNSRKRKLGEDDEEDEEEKVEKFFALIRDAQEVQKQIIRGGKDKRTEQQERNKAEERKKRPAFAPLCKLAFEPEDFIEVAADKQLKGMRTHQVAIVSFPRPSSSKGETEPKEEDIEEGCDKELDLKLSL